MASGVGGDGMVILCALVCLIVGGSVGFAVGMCVGFEMRGEEEKNKR